jgi:hypothetical protein
MIKTCHICKTKYEQPFWEYFWAKYDSFGQAKCICPKCFKVMKGGKN